MRSREISGPEANWQYNINPDFAGSSNLQALKPATVLTLLIGGSVLISPILNVLGGGGSGSIEPTSVPGIPENTPIPPITSTSEVRISPATPIPGSPIISAYGAAVDQQFQDLDNEFSAAGKEDLSGKGYDPCVVSSDCLYPDTCVPGKKPNTIAGPGYCVPPEVKPTKSAKHK